MAARPEERIQQAVHRWWRRHRPPGWEMTAIEHGIAFGGDWAARARKWQQLKAKGVKTGVEDLQFTGPGRFIAVELKHARNNQSDAQRAREAHVLECGFGYHVCRSVVEVARALAPAVPLTGWAMEDAAAADRALEVAVVKKAPGKPRKPRAIKGGLDAMARARASGVVV